MAQNVSFNINLKVNGEDVVKNVTMDMEELRKAIDTTRTEAQRFTDSLVQINQRVESVQNIAKGIQQLATTLSDLTEESRQYAAAMAAANTMAGKGGSDFAQLKGEVSDLAKTIPIARDLLAKGLYQVVSNGVPEDNWIEYLERSAKASVGGLANLEEVVKVTATVIKNYGLSWDEAGGIQDKIQLTAKYGVTSFEQLAQALPRVTANAATLGVTVNELMSVFATLTGVSGNTAEVSTQLAAVFTALVKPSSEAMEMAQRMGVEFNAAAVESAGGLQQFVKSLNESVKSFARSSGMLEQEIWGKLFGSAESLRALIPLTGELADKFDENVAVMENSAGTIDEAFGVMAATSSSKLQLLKNTFAGIGDVISGAMGWFLPFLNFGAQVGMTVAGVVSLSTAFKGVSISTKLASAAMAAFGPILQVVRATMTGATVSTQTLRLAIRSLMITTGVGIAVMALTEAINYFCSSADEASEKADDMSEAEDEGRRAMAQTKVAIDEETKKLKELIDAKKDAKEEIKHLNNAYGSVFGNHKTAAEWYDTLTKKSRAYVKQIGYEAQAKTLAAKLAEKEIKLEDNYSKQRVLWTTGNAVKTTKRIALDTQTGKATPFTQQKDTDEYAALKREANTLATEVEDLQRQLGIAQTKMAECAEEMQNITAGEKKALSVAEMNLAQLEKAIEETETKLKNTTEGSTISQLKSYEQQLQARKKVLEAKTGIGSYDTKQEPKFYTDPKDSHELSKNISYYEGKLSGQDSEEERRLLMQIQLWKQKRAEIELAKKAAQVPAELNTLEDVNTALEYLKAKRQLADSDALAGIDKDISKTELRGLELQRPKNLGVESTEDDINREIAYQQKLKATAEGSTDAIDKEIQRLERLKDKRTELQIMQDALSDLQNDFDNALTVEAKVAAQAKVDELQKQIDEATKGKLTIEAEVEPGYVVQGSTADKRQSYSNAQQKASRIQQDFEIGLIGKAEAETEIAELNKELESLGLKPIKIDIETKAFEKAMGKIKGSWGSVKGIGDGIEGITDAISENANAWQTISGVIDGFLQIAEGIQAIVSVVQMLTSATQAQTAAKTAEATATAVSTAATTADTVASAANTAVKSGEAVAGATASGASLPFPANLVAIAAGVAAVVAALAMVGSFASGGIVGGSSYSGDRLTARVNSGEMILNAQQQARLFAIANGAAVYGAAIGIGGEYENALKPREVKAQLEKLQRIAIEGQSQAEQRIRLKVRGRDLVEASGNELRSTRRRSNLR